MTVAPAAADWEALQRAIEGGVVLPEAPEYEAVRKPAMARFDDVRPHAVVLCETPGDVAATIAFARRWGVAAAVRSGGHCFAGRSSTSGVLLDVRRLRSVDAADGVAIVGAGARLADLYDALDAQGVTIPAGCGPTVGIAGLTLGGGLGIMGRQHGLTCDHLVQAEIVLADGRVVVCDDRHEPDLFWALRGAGGGQFGVVTSLTFATLPAPAVATAFHLVWPFAAAAAVIEAWQQWAPVAPDELDATLRIAAAAGRPPVVNLIGALQGSEAEAAVLLEQPVALAGVDPVEASRWCAPYRELKRSLVGLGSIEGDDAPEDGAEAHLFSKSEFFRRSLPREAITALLERLTSGVDSGHSRELNFTPWGGAYNRVASDATAFPHRDELFMIEHVAVVRDGEPAAARAWLRRSWQLAHSYGSGRVYPNFPDPDLENWPRAYHGENYERLVRVKAAYDPDNVFRFHQSIPPRP